jgi:DNA-binding CsgD family transcriptional regulator
VAKRSQDIEPPQLYGRASECATVEHLLTQARGGRSNALLIHGEAGIGKSALMAYARTRSDGMTALSVTGNEFDTDVSYAGIFDILRPRFDAIDRLPVAQRDALRSAFAMSSPTGGNRFTVAIGVLGLLSHLASDGPVLVTVDDAQWLDAASADAIGFVARRIAAEGIVLLIAERTTSITATRYGRIPTLAVSSLDEISVGELLSRSGGTQKNVELIRRLTAGNPLAILEYARNDADDGDASLSDESPVPTNARMRAAFLSQAAHLPESCRQALVYVAAAGLNDMSVLRTVLVSNNLDLSDLEAAESSDLVHVEAGQILFRHPLVRSAIYHNASPTERRRVHLSFADALGTQAAPALAERRITHLTMAGAIPDELLAGEMETVGSSAAARGGYAAAARMLERAAQLSTNTDNRARRYLLAATSALAAGRLTDLNRLMEATFKWATDHTTRVAASHLAYRAALWQGMPDTVRRHLAIVPPASQSDSVDAAVMSAEAALAALILGDRGAAAQESERAISRARNLPGRARMPGLLVRAFTHAIALEYDQAQRLLNEADPWIASRPGEQWPLIAPLVYFLLDDLAEASQRLGRVIAAMRQTGAIDLLPVPLLVQSRVELRRGDWSKARIAAHEAASLIESIGGSTSEVGGVFEPDCAAAMAVIEALRGDATACRQHARTCLEYGITHRIDFMIGHGRRALGLLHLGNREFPDAVMQFQQLAEMASSFGLPDTPILPWLADLAESQLATDDRVGALTTIGQLEAHAAKVGTTAAKGLLERCQAMAADPPDPQILEGSARRLAAAGLPFESARSQLYAGEIHRRRKGLGRARELLFDAFDAFDALDASPWRERAAVELRAGGTGVPQQPGTKVPLTPQELQVAHLAADGASNAEIAITLFLSKKTIEFHLGNAYRKLGVRRRSQLTKALQHMGSTSPRADTY